MRVFDFVINRDGGAARKIGAEKICQTLNSIFGPETGRIDFVAGGEITQAVNRWIGKYREDNNHILMIGGGDGTILTAATEAMKNNIAFGIVPLGTQGFVKKILRLDADFAIAMRAYKTGTLTTQSLDVGRVNDRAFLYGLMLDPASVNLFEAREEFRTRFSLHGLHKSIAFIMGVLFGPPRTLQNNGKVVRGRFVTVTVNTLKPCTSRLSDILLGPKQVFGNMFARCDPADEQLVLYTHPGGFWPVLAMLPKLWNGTWCSDRLITRDTQKSFALTAPENEIGVILDGEIARMSFPMTVDIASGALRLYKPEAA